VWSVGARFLEDAETSADVHHGLSAPLAKQHSASRQSIEACSKALKAGITYRFKDLSRLLGEKEPKSLYLREHPPAHSRSDGLLQLIKPVAYQ